MTEPASPSDSTTPCCGAVAAAPSDVFAKPLSAMKRGETGVVCESQLTTSDAALLRAMGLHQAARVRLCRVGEPCIVAVAGSGSECGCGSTCRIGLAKALAQRIYVSVDPVKA